MGRPTIYTEEVVDKICELVASGKSLVKICREKDMPSVTQVHKWLTEKQDFADKYDLAKAACMEYLAEEILEIGDDTKESIHDRRLRTDLRKWNMARLAPKGRKDQKEEEPLTQGALELALAEIVEQIKGAK